MRTALHTKNDLVDLLWGSEEVQVVAISVERNVDTGRCRAKSQYFRPDERRSTLPLVLDTSPILGMSAADESELIREVVKKHLPLDTVLLRPSARCPGLLTLCYYSREAHGSQISLCNTPYSVRLAEGRRLMFTRADIPSSAATHLPKLLADAYAGFAFPSEECVKRILQELESRVEQRQRVPTA
jgi:hypothetical protein